MNSIQFQGQIRKMITEYQNPVAYYLDLNDGFIAANQLIGKQISVEHIHNECLNCSLDNEIFRMGYCKSCFFEVPQTNESVIRPELSKAHLGIEEKDLAWEKEFELQPHIVYLAVSSGLKVGVTRSAQVPTRWIDQGASSAIVLAKTNNRYEAGQIEVALAKHISDKTNYQRMLKNQVEERDLIAEKDTLKELIPEGFKHFYAEDNRIWTIDYPVEEYPTKVKSLNLSKTKEYKGKLKGIKGQYFIFEDNTVWNVRSHEGFVVEFRIG